MRKKENITALVLLIALFLSINAPLLLQLKIFRLKAEAGERLEKDHLQTVHIPINTVYWTDYGEELLIGRRLFDVKEYHRADSDLVATGVFDDEETQLQQLVEDSWQKSPKQNGDWVKCFQPVFNIYLQEEDLHITHYTSAGKKYFNDLILFQKNIFIEIPSPPPQARNTLLV